MVPPMLTSHNFIGSRGLLSALLGVFSPARSALLLLCAALLSLAGCGANDPVFTKLFTTEHFVYYAEERADPPCDGTEQWLERYYSANAKFLGAALPPGERIEYYLARSLETQSKVGCPEATGCTKGTTIHAKSPVHPHEIVHANAFLLGYPPVLFQEGLAVVLSCTTTTDITGPVNTSEPIEQQVETAAFIARRDAEGTVAYNASASFVRFLIDKFGSSLFLAFYARAPLDASRKDIESVFQSEMGVSLDDAFSDWRTNPPPHFGDLCLRLMECDPSMPQLADADLTLGCGPSGVSGLNQEAVLRFEVPKERIIRVTTEPIQAEPQVVPSVGFYRCTGGDAIGKKGSTAGIQLGADHSLHIDPAQPANAFALDVAPGKYVAWFTALAEARVHVNIEERKSPMSNTPCQAAEEPLALDDKHQTILTSRWIERPCSGPWCPGQGWDVSIGATGGALEAQTLQTNNGEAIFSPGKLLICSDSCPQDTSNCEIIALDPLKGSRVRSKQTFEPGAVVHVGAPAASDAEYFAVQLRVAPK